MSRVLRGCLIIALLAVNLGTSKVIADTNSRLQPLKYNDPDLVVDLGVGLWAWPMPVDYNNDGLVDLLVACPDKPSNGVWYFENTGKPSRAHPVFKKAIRIGQASHNMQVSYVDGKPRILVPGHEITDFTASAFRQRERIYSKDNVHVTENIRANMWRYADLNGDGSHDLIVGVGDWGDLVWDHAYNSSGSWQNGKLHGLVYWIENRGTNQAPEYSDQPIPLTDMEGSLIDVFGWPSPNLADFDGDNDLDLLCGEFLDGFTYFENLGGRKEPQFAVGRRLIASDGNPLVMHVQMITPTAFDWTEDGSIDLIVGDEDGRVALVENTGKTLGGMPVFHQPVYFQQQADTLKFGALATPVISDWDNDGLPDIVSGNTAGEVGWFRNRGPGSDGLPQWAAPELLIDTKSDRPFRIMAGANGSIQGPCEAKWGYTCFSLADWNRDGQKDVIYNSILGRLGLLLGMSEPNRVTSSIFDTGVRELPPVWYWWQWPSCDTLTQWRTTPLVLDFTGDGKLDLIALDQQGYLVLRRAAQSAERIFVDEDNRPIRLNAGTCGRSGRAKLAMVDWDSDGRLDLLVNSQNATWYRNCENRNGLIVFKQVGDLADRNVSGHTCSPTTGDLDGSGQPGLLLGAEDGRMYYIRHADCTVYDAESTTARPPQPATNSKFPGFVSEEFIYEKASFPECHASTIVETSRGLVAAWFGGSYEKHPDVGIWSSFHDGKNWSQPKEWATGVQYDGKRHPCWNPVLFQPPGDAPTLLFFKVGPDPSNWWGEYMLSYDRGRSFRDRKRLPEDIIGPVRCKPIVVGRNTLLCGSSTEHDGWTVHFERVSLLAGRPAENWNRIGPINSKEEFSAIQPTLLQHADGKLQALCRTKNGAVSSSVSEDRGGTWSTMTEIDLPNNNSGIDAVTLSDGRHLLIYNHLGSGKSGWGRRGMLNLAISEDGLSWRKVGILEQEADAEFSYPAMIQSSDGIIHATWTWKRQKIKHVVIDPAKIIAGDLLSKSDWDRDSN